MRPTARWPPAPLPTDALKGLESRVQGLLATGSLGDLEILGYGDFSVVFALRTTAGEFACKRLPPFRDRDQLARHEGLIAEYLAAVGGVGVDTLPTAVVAVPGPGGACIGYAVQPLVATQDLLPRVLARAEGAEADSLVDQLGELVHAAVSPRVGLDADISNWCLSGGRLMLLDTSTPLLRDEIGRDRIDPGPFLASLPMPIRAALRLHGVGRLIAKFFEVRGVCLDVVCGFYREGLDELARRVLPRLNRGLRPPISPAELRRTYRSNEWLWHQLRRLQRLERWWRTRPRGGHYPFVLAPHEAFAHRLSVVPPRS